MHVHYGCCWLTLSDMCCVQAEAKLVSVQKDMRHAPLEDPSLFRGEALSQALAKELTQLFQAVNQKTCFAQMASAAQQHGLQQAHLPSKLLQVNTCITATVKCCIRTKCALHRMSLPFNLGHMSL